MGDYVNIKFYRINIHGIVHLHEFFTLIVLHMKILRLTKVITKLDL